MDGVLCVPSAFKYWRIPPQVLSLCPPLPIGDFARHRSDYLEHPLVNEILGLPLSRLLVGGRHPNSTSNLTNHAWSGPLPAGAVVQSELGIEVASPAFTLLTLANQVSYITLVMCAYELCGSFAVFKPSPRIEEALASPRNHAAFNMSGAWERVCSANGKASNLWSREPLIDIDELRNFAANTDGMRGHRALVRAANDVRGVAASPFEVQAAMLLSLDTRLGGCGFKDLQLNRRIWLSASARAISGRSSAIADLYFEGEEGVKLDIECQSRMIHNSAPAAIEDSNRSLSLQMMGVTVLPITFEQVHDEKRFDRLADHIAKVLGRRRARRSERYRVVEVELRAQIFCDWSRLVA